MKIAILISGRVTDDIAQYNNFKRVFYSGGDIDIFVSHTKNIPSNFCDLYSPANIIKNDEIYDDVSMFDKNPETNIHNTMCMFLNRKKLNNMMVEYGIKHKKTYDFVISTRCDIWFDTEHFPYNELNEYINDHVYIPHGNDWGGINDQFAVGSPSSMTDYLNVYDNIIPMAKKGTRIHPETLLNTHLLEKNCSVKRFDLSYIIRR